MRLNRLDLTRYGRFTDLSLAFPAPAPGAPDLHVIHGANEAGKSTLLEGWLDLLFQIPVRSSMNFMHPYGSMQLGAELQIGGRTQDVLRIKKRDNSLLDSSGAMLGEAVLHEGLRGLDRASYAAMFSLNCQTLDEGGESILASKGDLGQLLFQASAGLTDLAAQIEEMTTRSEEFLNRTGRKGRLRDLGKELDDLGAQIRELDTAAAEYGRLSQARDTARTEWQKARAAAEQAQAAMMEADRRIGALPMVNRLQQLDDRIAGYGTLPDAPEGWLAELPELDRADTVIATRLSASQAAVAELTAEIECLVPDREVLDLAEHIAAAEGLKSAYDQALTDLPKRIRERDAKLGAVRECLSRLDRAGEHAASILLPAGVLGRLRGLAERHSGIETAHDAALLELEDARAELDRAVLRRETAGGDVADLGGLSGLVRALRRDDLPGARARAMAECDKAAAALREARTALLPWEGTDADLACAAPPDPARLDALAARIDDARREGELAAGQAEQLDAAAAQAREKQNAIGAGSTITLEEAARLRAIREAEWSRHRAALTGETADSFEAALRRDDIAASALGDQRAHAEKTAEAARVLAQAESLAEAARLRSAAAAGRGKALAAELDQLVRVCLPGGPGLEMPAFRSWLAKLATARQALARRDEAASDLARCDAVLDRARADLFAALAQAGRPQPEDTGFMPALETAQSLLDRSVRIDALREAEAQARQDFDRRTRRLEEAVAARGAWQAEWSAACSETWMADAPPGVAEMRAILEELDRLRDHHGQAEELERRIASMQDNQTRFETAVRDIATALEMDPKRPALDLWRDLTRRAAAAQARETERAGLAERAARAESARAQTEAEAAIHRDRTDVFAAHFGVGTWPEARDALTRAGELAKRREERAVLIGDLCERMRCATVEEALAGLRDLDVDMQIAQSASLKEDADRLARAQEEAQDTFRKAHDAVEGIGGDAAVARLEEQRQTLLLEIEDGARRHLRERLGLLAVEAALKRYRDTHRSGMLDRASEAFRLMSRDRYSGLSAQPDGTREVLVALSREGGSKQADQLSDGTRAQLYLALRIAGYHEFVRSSGPVPFIADDIMESFDDHRAAEAFALLSSMSESGQVIYLTHHAHLVELARKTCPGVQVHELPD